MSKKEIHRFSPDIRKIPVNRIISFNYTDTYRQIYKKLHHNCCHFIHGRAMDNRTAIQNNMVMGVDDFNYIKSRPYDTWLIVFKKFYQRIYKKTGNRYKKWLKHAEFLYKIIYRFLSQELIDNHALLHIYFFGHSLDETDGDVIKELILNPYAKVTIFYLNKSVYAQQIMNLVRIIGKDKVIEKTGDGSLEFVQQKDMEGI